MLVAAYLWHILADRNCKQELEEKGDRDPELKMTNNDISITNPALQNQRMSSTFHTTDELTSTTQTDGHRHDESFQRGYGSQSSLRPASKSSEKWGMDNTLTEESSYFVMNCDNAVKAKGAVVSNRIPEKNKPDMFNDPFAVRVENVNKSETEGDRCSNHECSVTLAVTGTTVHQTSSNQRAETATGMAKSDSSQWAQSATEWEQSRSQCTQTVTEKNKSVLSACSDVDNESASLQQPLGDRSRSENENDAGGPKFSPPVYIQRYKLVKEIMQEHGVESIVDFGSSECKILRWLKEVDTARRITLVDIDGDTLRGNSLFVKPLNCEYIMRRLTPLTVTVLEGNAGQLDPRVAGCQAASLVEVIEHLEADVLREVTQCVFGRLRPPLVVVTTPNSDFNVLFPNFTGFRHWDHKFEWTRQEFEQWCDAVCGQHGYSVSYTGVGDPPPDKSHLGFCSQAATFTEVRGQPGENTHQDVYTLVTEVIYPHDQRTRAQRLTAEVDYIVHSYSGCSDRRHAPTASDTSVEGRAVVAVPLVEVARRVVARRSNKDKWSMEEVTDHLRTSCSLTEDGQRIVVASPDGSSSSEDEYDDTDVQDGTRVEEGERDEEESLQQISDITAEETEWE